MHPTEQQNSFLILRANGWSLGKISHKLDVPKSTLFHWEREHRAQIHLLKCMQVEKLQEKYAPSYEEELQHLSSYLARVERALQQHSFDQMRPEFLLQTALHLRGRLNKLRADVPLNAPIEQAGLEPLSVGGCISRAEKPILAPDYESAPLPELHLRQEAADPIILPLPQEEEGGVEEERHIQTAVRALTASRAHQNGTFSHENGVGSKLDASASTTSNTENGTTVPFSDREETTPQLVPNLRAPNR